MKKITSILIIFSIIFGGLGAAAFSTTESESYELLQRSIRLQKNNIIIEEKGQEYLQISLLNNEHYLLNPGKPVIPKLVHTFELPFGVTNINVLVSQSETRTQNVLKQIQPSPAPLPLSPIEGYEVPDIKDEQLYQSMDPYPSEWYRYNVGVGVNEHFEHVTFVTVHLYPIQYIPGLNNIKISEKSRTFIIYYKHSRFYGYN